MLNDFTYYENTDLIKDLLLDTRTMYEIFITQCCAVDGKYWSIVRQRFVYDKNSSFSNPVKYQKPDQFYTDSLDHAIACIIINQKSGYYPVPTLAGYDDVLYDLTINYELDSDQARYKLTVEEVQVRDNRRTVVYTIGAPCLNILLFKIPLVMQQMEKFTPFGFNTSDVIEINPIIRFPYFLYDGILFKSKVYYHDKKEIHGTSPEYWNHYDNNNEIRINIYKVKTFMEERMVYIINRWAYYNGKRKLVFKKDLFPKIWLGSRIDVLKAYPDAVGISRDGVIEKWA